MALTRNQQLEFCERCLHRKLSLQRGLLCGLTQEPAAFTDSCPDYQEDAAVPPRREEESAPIPGWMQGGKKRELADDYRSLYLAYERFDLAMLGGFFAAVLAAFLWAATSLLFEYQISYMAAGLGFLVAYAVRFFGAGVSLRFRLLSAVLALLGTLLGNVLTEFSFYAQNEGLSVWGAMGQFTVSEVAIFFLENTRLIDLFFYVVAVAAGYQFALRQPTDMEIAQRYSPLFDPVPPHQSKRLPLLFAAFFLIALIISKNLEPFRGVVKYYYEDGSLLSEGNMIEGKQDGYWAYYDRKGHLIQTGMHQDGYAHGDWTWYHSDNKAVQMVQPYTYGNAMGLNRSFRNNGTLIDSVNFYNGRKNGEYVSYNDMRGIVSRGRLQHDRREGEWLFFYDSGELKMRINYLEGDLHGRCLFYHPNGVLAEELHYEKGRLAYIHTQNAGDGSPIIRKGKGYYRVLTEDPAINGSGYVEDGQPVGEWELYAPQIGQLNKGRFEGATFLLWQSSLPNLKMQVKAGKGYYKEHDQNGKTVLLEGKINNGLREGRWKSRYENGVLKADETYKNGQLTGKATYYYSDGQIEYTAHFKAGKWHGKAQFFNENGTLDSEALFKNDLKTGIQYFYDEKGQLIREELYTQGRLTKTKLNFRDPEMLLSP